MADTPVLVVGDDPWLTDLLLPPLEDAGYAVCTAPEGGAALALLRHQPVGMVVTDVQTGPMDGFQLLETLQTEFPQLPVLLTSGSGDVAQAVRAMQSGAVDYLLKPFDVEVLLERIGRFVTPCQWQGPTVVAEDVRTRELLELAQRVAQSEATVLLGGESGTGKEVFAHYIHCHSPRRDGPLVAINCAAIPDNMLEAMLFGFEKGAFTGAHQTVPGKFEQAQDGTLLLDEISEMSLGLQAKLLRVLQEREVERLGGRTSLQLNVRVLATSNRRLREEVAAGRFREDLFYRLNVFPLTLPPLRERPRDILPLVRYMIAKRARPGVVPPELSDAAEQRLLGHSWPGNVRELDNLLQRALILHRAGRIEVSDLSFEPEDGPAAAPVSSPGGGARAAVAQDLRSMEQKMILDALRQGNGSRKSAAERLGISPRTLRYKLARLRDAGVTIPR